MPKVSESHSAARRQQIIDAAYRCFARKGFHVTTMRDIYEEANLSPGAIYHYFDSKVDIIRASFEFDRERSADRFNAAMADPNPVAALRELAEFFFRGMESAATLGAGRVNVQGWGDALIDPQFHESILQGINSYLEALSQIVRNAQQAGQIPPTIEPRAVGHLLLSVYYGLELQKALMPELDVESYRTAVGTLLFSTDSQRSWLEVTNEE